MRAFSVGVEWEKDDCFRLFAIVDAHEHRNAVVGHDGEPLKMLRKNRRILAGVSVPFTPKFEAVIIIRAKVVFDGFSGWVICCPIRKFVGDEILLNYKNSLLDFFRKIGNTKEIHSHLVEEMVILL